MRKTKTNNEEFRGLKQNQTLPCMEVKSAFNHTMIELCFTTYVAA